MCIQTVCFESGNMQSILEPSVHDLGSKKQRKQVMWFDAVVDNHQNYFGRAQQERPQRRT